MIYTPYVISTCNINSSTERCKHLSTDSQGKVCCAKAAAVPDDLMPIPGGTIEVDCHGVSDFGKLEASLMKSKAGDIIMEYNSKHVKA